MVNIFTTAFVGDDSASILHKHVVVALDSHGDGSLLEGTSQLLWVHLGNIDEVRNADSRLGPVSLATLASQPLVGVVLLEHHAVVLSVPESAVHGTTKAAFVAVNLGAVDKLLL